MMGVPEYTIQGSDAWLSWRKTRGGASEVAALMGCSPWFPRTPFELFQTKTGRAEVQMNNAMTRGLNLEEAARDYLEDRLSEAFEPQVVEHGRIVASLDGMSFDGVTIIEIKIPASGKDSETWKHVVKHNAPPDHYWHQCQQALYVSGADTCILAVCAAEGSEIIDAVMCSVYPDKDAHRRIQAAWDEFFGYLDSGTPPPLTDRDVVERTDPEWRDAAEAYRMAKRSLENAQNAEHLARERLQELAGGCSAEGCGVRVTRFTQKGAIKYSEVPELSRIDLEQYRKPDSIRYRITEAKE